MSASKIIDGLRQEANRNPISNVVFQVFATRKRSRGVINLVSLYETMKKEGYNYPRTEYVPVLKTLADLGIGTLIFSPTGKVRGLKHVGLTLKSLGEAAVGESNSLRNIRTKTRYRKLIIQPSSSLPPRPAPTPLPLPTPPSAPAPTLTQLAPVPTPISTQNKSSEIDVVFKINGKELSVHVPKNFTTSEVAYLIDKFKSA